IVLFQRDCSQHIPSQSTARDHCERLRPVVGPGRCGFIWCEFLAVRATPTKASCSLAWAMVGPGRRIHGRTRVGPNGRDLELPEGNPDRTTGPMLAAWGLLVLVPAPRRCSACYTFLDLGGG